MKADRKLAHAFFDGQSILIFGVHRLDTLGSLAYDPCLYNHSQAMGAKSIELSAKSVREIIPEATSLLLELCC